MKYFLTIMAILLASISGLLAQDPVLPGQVGEQLVPNGLQHENLTGEDVADMYRKFTGKKVFPSIAASAAEFKISQPGPLTYAEAAEALEIHMLMEGFILVPFAEDKVKLVLNSGQGAGPQGESPFYDEEEDLPPGDLLATYKMELEFLKPEEAARTFQQVIGAGQGTTISPVANASSVIITAKTPVIRTLIAIKDTIDVPSARISSRNVELKYADVEVVSEILNNIFSGNSRNNNTARAQRNAPTTPVPVPNAGAQGGGAAGEETPPTIIPYAPTNKIFLLGRPVDLVFIEGLIAEFDKPNDDRNFLSRKLKFLAVSDFLDTAVEALTDPTGSSNAQGGGASAPRSNNRSNRQTRGGGGGNQPGGGGAGGGNSLQDTDIDTAPVPRRVGKTFLVADNLSNSLIVQGPPRSIDIINQLLDKLDVRSDQILISAIFGQLTLSDNVSTAFALLNDNGAGAEERYSGGFNVPTVGDDGALPDLLSAAAPIFGGAGTISVFGSFGDFNAFFNAMASDSNFKTIARPAVYTSNNERAVLSSGRRIAIPTGQQSGFGGGGINTNISFEDVELQLEVIPLVNSKDEVTLEIALISNDVGSTSRSFGGTGDNAFSVPDIITREIITKVTVPNRATIALGGLITTRQTDSESGVPILKDIPVLGRLFSTDSKSEERDELVIFIQPTIVNSEASLASVQDEFNRRHEMSKAAHELADGKGVLPEKPTGISTDEQKHQYRADQHKQWKEYNKWVWEQKKAAGRVKNNFEVSEMQQQQPQMRQQRVKPKPKKERKNFFKGRR